MNTFIYCGFSTIESAQFIVYMTSIEKIKKPTAGYISLEKSLENQEKVSQRLVAPLIGVVQKLNSKISQLEQEIAVFKNG